MPADTDLSKAVHKAAVEKDGRQVCQLRTRQEVPTLGDATVVLRTPSTPGYRSECQYAYARSGMAIPRPAQQGREDFCLPFRHEGARPNLQSEGLYL